MDVVDFISVERLKTYESHTDSQKRAIALHNHTLQLGSSLMSMIALMELSLRNCTNQCLIEDFGDNEWLLPGRTIIPLSVFEQNATRAAFQHAQKAAYAKLSYREKLELDAKAFPGGIPPGTSHATVVKKRQALFDVKHGQVIAQTTLSFWKRLYSSEYQNTL